ncbi:MAG: hypothetical protein GX643_12765 [Acidimicrobiales bacterium]|nr:hypothetical protein [Acidimicrobiales bacterium]
MTNTVAQGQELAKAMLGVDISTLLQAFMASRGLSGAETAVGDGSGGPGAGSGSAGSTGSGGSNASSSSGVEPIEGTATPADT